MKWGSVGLKIEFKTKKLKNECESVKVATRTYGKLMAEKIIQRMNELKSADSLEFLLQYSIGRCHALKGDRCGEYAMDLEHPFRLVFSKKEDNSIQVLRILTIEDYH